MEEISKLLTDILDSGLIRIVISGPKKKRGYLKDKGTPC